MRYLVLLVLLIFLAVAPFFLWRFFPHPQTAANRAVVEIKGATLLVGVARDSAAQTRGLSGRESIPEFGGILFLFDAPGYYEIWMKDMKIPIDILWLRNGRVADMEENALPPAARTSNANLKIYRPDAPADAVLEVKSGFSSRFGVRIGDAVSVKLMSAADNQKQQFSFVGNAALENETDEIFYPQKYYIEIQRQNFPQGSDFTVGRAVSETRLYRVYEITYKSNGLLISGLMSVPRDKPSQNGFPLISLSRGAIKQETNAGSRGIAPEEDFFAKHGYVAISIDYRGYGSSVPKPATHYDFYADSAEDLINLTDALRKARLPFIDLERIGVWGYSAGGGIAERVAVLAPEVRAYVLFAPISADVEDNIYKLPDEEVAWLRQNYGPAGSEAYKKMSPLYYFADISAPVQIHHGTADAEISLRFSEKIYDAFIRNGKKAEFFKYPNEDHDFTKTWLIAMERSLQFFDKYVK